MVVGGRSFSCDMKCQQRLGFGLKEMVLLSPRHPLIEQFSLGESLSNSLEPYSRSASWNQ